MHKFDFTFDFTDWTDEQIERMIILLGDVGEYNKRNALLNYLYPTREEIITIIDLNGKKRTSIETIRGW